MPGATTNIIESPRAESSAARTTWLSGAMSIGRRVRLVAYRNALSPDLLHADIIVDFGKVTNVCPHYLSRADHVRTARFYSHERSGSNPLRRGRMLVCQRLSLGSESGEWRELVALLASIDLEFRGFGFEGAVAGLVPSQSMIESAPGITLDSERDLSYHAGVWPRW